MAMAGLGSVDEILDWPFRYYLAIRRSYLRAIAPPKRKDDDGVIRTQIAPGVTMERYDTREK